MRARPPRAVAASSGKRSGTTPAQRVHRPRFVARSPRGSARATPHATGRSLLGANAATSGCSPRPGPAERPDRILVLFPDRPRLEVRTHRRGPHIQIARASPLLLSTIRSRHDLARCRTRRTVRSEKSSCLAISRVVQPIKSSSMTGLSSGVTARNSPSTISVTMTASSGVGCRSASHPDSSLASVQPTSRDVAPGRH